MEDVDDAVEKVQHNPEIGEQKIGDLAELRVFKFRSNGQLYLLGYTLDESISLIYLESVGSHENFYRDLKQSIGTLKS
jgi:ParE-like toxin of type II bacterial toxin-antitoxin system